MISGVGIDIVEIARMKRWLSNDKLLERFFHPQEIEYVKSRGAGALASLAARFAAKEAFGKALGTGIRGFSLRNVRVAPSEGGKPRLMLCGDALEAAKGAGQMHLSLSHDGGIAAAIVVIEGNPVHRSEVK